MHWLFKQSESDIERIEHNIARWLSLRDYVHNLGDFVFASQSGGYNCLLKLLDNNLIKSNDNIHKHLHAALVGANNQKVALDSPWKFQYLMRETEKLIEKEIALSNREIRKIKLGK
mgnify:CR=1 FL=1